VLFLREIFMDVFFAYCSFFSCLSFSGTPIQNDLLELVSLLNFIMPGLFFDHLEALTELFDRRGPAGAILRGQTGDTVAMQRVERARRIMVPFLLRRKKADVISELPQKIEILKKCVMTTSQHEMYQEMMRESKKCIADAVAATGAHNSQADAQASGARRGRGRPKKSAGGPAPKEAQKSLAGILMRLRKIANHPLLERRLYDNQRLREMSKKIMKVSWASPTSESSLRQEF
jgi:SWI/SNF-related matrix-associated actin-dependent regulator 1 of chromatin subfamily A